MRTAKTPIRSDWADAQANICLRWAPMPFCWFCHEAAYLESGTRYGEIYRVCNVMIWFPLGFKSTMITSLSNSDPFKPNSYIVKRLCGVDISYSFCISDDFLMWFPR